MLLERGFDKPFVEVEREIHSECDRVIYENSRELVNRVYNAPNKTANLTDTEIIRVLRILPATKKEEIIRTYNQCLREINRLNNLGRALGKKFKQEYTTYESKKYRHFFQI